MPLLSNLPVNMMSLFCYWLLKPAFELNNRPFNEKLFSHIEDRRSIVQLSMKVTEVSVILYQQRIQPLSKFLKQWSFHLNKEIQIPDFFKNHRAPSCIDLERGKAIASSKDHSSPSSSGIESKACSKSLSKSAESWFKSIDSNL